jgi:hypothetical protein
MKQAEPVKESEETPVHDWRSAPWGQGVRRRFVSQAARDTLQLRENTLSLWHGVLFTLNVGVPTIMGAVTGEMHAGVVGGIAGMIFSLSDSDDSIRTRLLLLGRALLMLLCFGTLGTLWGGYTPAFWATFLALTFLSGWLSVGASTWTSAFRNGAMALVTTAGLPGTTWTTAVFVGLAALVSAATRAYGAWRFPEAPTVLPPAKPFEEARGWSGFRFCFVYAGAVALGLLLGKLQGVERPVWVATTVLLIMQPEASASYKRSVQRVFGTLIGVVAAGLVVTVLHSLQTLGLAVLLIAFGFPHGAALLLVAIGFCRVAHSGFVRFRRRGSGV